MCPTLPIAPAVLTCPYPPVCPCVPRLLSLCGPTLPIAPAVLTCPLPMCHYTLQLLLLCGPTLLIALAVLTCPPPPTRLPLCVMGHRYVHQPCHSPLNFTIVLYTHQPKQLRQARLAYQSPAPAMPRSSSKRKSNKRQERHTHTRSASPTQTGSSRGRYQSHSPPARENSYTPRQGETRPRDNSRRTRGEHDQFFRSGADSRGAVCATCLGRHEHAFGKCTARKLWNGAAAGAKKNGYGDAPQARQHARICAEGRLRAQSPTQRSAGPTGWWCSDARGSATSATQPIQLPTHSDRSPPPTARIGPKLGRNIEHWWYDGSQANRSTAIPRSPAISQDIY